MDLTVHNTIAWYLNWIELMNCFCGMVDRRKAFSLISSRDHCQRSSSSRISDTPSRVCTCVEPEPRLSWMKLCSSDIRYTTAPPNFLIKLSKQIDNSFAKIINTKVSSKLYQTCEMGLLPQVVTGFRGELWIL